MITEAFQADPFREELQDLLQGLRSAFGNHPFTAKDVREFIESRAAGSSSLGDTRETMCTKVSANSIGIVLRNRVGRRVSGMHLVMRRNPKSASQFQVVSDQDAEGQVIDGTILRLRAPNQHPILARIPK